eukprot:UN12845
MINYLFMGSLQPYVCVPIIPQWYPKIVRCKNMIFRLSNTLSIAFIRRLHHFMTLIKVAHKLLNPKIY